MSESTEVCFSQYAQDPLENFDELYPDLSIKHREPKERKSKPKRENAKKKNNLQPKSFVISKEPRRGIHLIKIKVIDLTMDSQQSLDSDNDESILSAQYVVKDAVDEIMDLTESVINKISKKLCGYNF